MRRTSATTAPPVTPQKPENGRRNIFPPTPPETPESKLEYHGRSIPFVLTPPVTPEKKCKNPEERNTFPLTPPKTPERFEKEAFLLSPASTPKTQERSKKPEKSRCPTPDSLSAGYLEKPELTVENLRKNNIEISFEPNTSCWPKHVSELKSYLLTNLIHDELPRDESQELGKAYGSALNVHKECQDLLMRQSSDEEKWGHIWRDIFRYNVIGDGGHKSQTKDGMHNKFDLVCDKMFCKDACHDDGSLTFPKPDIMLGFTTCCTTVAGCREHAENKCFDQKVLDGLQKGSGFLSSPLTPNKKFCFPWGIFEAKAPNVRIKPDPECQAANAAVKCLQILENLGNKTNSAQKSQSQSRETPPIPCFTCRGPIWTLWICYRSREDESQKSTYQLDKIFEGDMNKQQSCQELLYIVGRLKNWALGTFKPWVEVHLDSWIKLSIKSKSPLRSRYKIQEPNQGEPDLEGTTVRATDIGNEESTREDLNHPLTRDTATGHIPNSTHTFTAGEEKKEGAMRKGPRESGTKISVVSGTGITLHLSHVQLVTLDTRVRTFDNRVCKCRPITKRLGARRAFCSPHPGLTWKKFQNSTKKEDLWTESLKAPAKYGIYALPDSKDVMLAGKTLEQILFKSSKIWAKEELSKKKTRPAEVVGMGPGEVETTPRKYQQKSILSAFWCQFLDCIPFPETISDLFVLLLVFGMVHIMIVHKPITDSALVVEWLIFGQNLLHIYFVEFVCHSF